MFALPLAVVAGWTIADYAIAVVILLAVIALVYVAARAFGTPLPEWFFQVVGIVVVCVIVIVAIRFVASL
jgi:hypothetical protein